MAEFNGNGAYNANLFMTQMGVDPILFAQNVVQKSTQTNNFINSGIVQEDPIMASQLLQPGDRAVLPYFNDLYGQPQTWSDSSNIDVNPITAGHENAVKLRQAQAFGFTDLAKLRQVGDPLSLIQGQFSDYWKRQDESTVLSLLQGVFANPKIAEHNVYSADSGQTFNVTSFERAVSLLADYQDNTFNAIAVHPAVYAQMKAQNYINLTGNDTPLNRAASPFGTYNGMNVVVDRRLPIQNGVATSYIFAQGAIMYSTAFPENGGYEFYRHPGVAGGENQLFSKRVYTAHVHGTTVADGYQAANGNDEFTTADLTNPNMWDLVWDPLHVHIVAYQSKVDTGYATQFYDDEAEGESRASSAAQRSNNSSATSSGSNASNNSSTPTSH